MSGSLFSNESSKKVARYQWPQNTLIEFRLSYFYPISDEFREIFGSGGIDYQVSGVFPFYYGDKVAFRRFGIWGAVDYFSKTGSSLGQHLQTKIEIIPLTLGLKYFYPIRPLPGHVDFYVGGGMKYYFVHTRNDCTLVTSNLDRDGMGLVFEGGLLATFKKHFTLDVFLSYSYKSFGAPVTCSPSVQGIGLEVSSLNVGGGVGYKF